MNINQPTIEYVTTFVPKETGDKFNPHVTIGIATQNDLKKMLEEKFEPFTFSPTGRRSTISATSGRPGRNSRVGN
jgi:hypothetical protein